MSELSQPSIVTQSQQIILALELYHFSLAPPGSRTAIFYKILSLIVSEMCAVLGWRSWQSIVHSVKTQGLMKRATR